MSLEAQLWREVGQHLELDQSIERLLALLSEFVPLQSLSIHRFERVPPRLTRLAASWIEGSDVQDALPARFELSAESGRAFWGLLERGTPLLIQGHDLGLAASLTSSEGVDVIVLPLLAQEGPVGAALLLTRRDFDVTASHLDILSQALGPLAVAFENDQRLQELARMRAALEADREALLSKLQRHDLGEVVIGASGGLLPVMERVLQVARTDAPVLILGETGSGKEVIARNIHARSPRAKGPIVRINCGAIPAELVDSELFGHEKGSFTGATSVRKGWFERADGGTLFLDEIGELPSAAQVRLLRVLQDGTLERVGGHQTITVDVRIVAATHRQLETMVQSGTFREDLWYRLSVFPIRLPALREHLEDLPELARYFAERAGKRLGGAGLCPSTQDLDLLGSYAWPGNVRELSAVIERAAILGNGKRLDVLGALGGDTPRLTSPAAPVGQKARQAEPKVPSVESIVSLDQAIADHICRALSACYGRIEGPFGAARILRINPHTLRARMRKLGIEWSQFRDSSSVVPPASRDGG